jgi:hypothetical protein
MWDVGWRMFDVECGMADVTFPFPFSLSLFTLPFHFAFSLCLLTFALFTLPFAFFTLPFALCLLTFNIPFSLNKKSNLQYWIKSIVLTTTM